MIKFSDRISNLRMQEGTPVRINAKAVGVLENWYKTNQDLRNEMISEYSGKPMSWKLSEKKLFTYFADVYKKIDESTKIPIYKKMYEDPEVVTDRNGRKIIYYKEPPQKRAKVTFVKEIQPQIGKQYKSSNPKLSYQVAYTDYKGRKSLYEGEFGARAEMAPKDWQLGGRERFEEASQTRYQDFPIMARSELLPFGGTYLRFALVKYEWAEEDIMSLEKFQQWDFDCADPTRYRTGYFVLPTAMLERIS